MGNAVRLCAGLLVCLVGAACGDDSASPDAAPGLDSSPSPDAAPSSDAPPAPDATIDGALSEADAAVDAAADAAVDAPIDAPVDAPIDAPVDAPIDAPADARVDASVDAGVDAPIDSGAAGNPPPTGSCRGDWCWVYPLPQGHTIHALWGASADDIWALTEGGVLVRYRAGSWTTHELTPRPTTGDLWGTAANDVWAATSTGLRHWNGTTWSLALSGSFGLVGGTGPADVWAYSGNGFSHWNGTGWTDRALPTGWVPRAIGGTPGNVIVVSSNGGIAVWRNNTWAIADGGSRIALAADIIDDTHVVITQPGALGFWNGTGWTTQATPASAQWSVVSARSFSDVWFYGGVAAGDQRLYRWDGATFTLLPRAGVNANVSALWAGAAGDTWMANLGAQIHSWSGSAWTPITSGHNFISGVAGTADDDVWMISESGRPSYINNVVHHWDGSTWTAAAFPFDATTYWNHDVAAIAPDDVWIASGRWPSGDRIHREMLHWNGTTWTVFAGMGSEDAIWAPVGFSSVWASGPDDVYAVARTAVYHFDGGVWSRITAVPGGVQVFGSATDDVYIINGTTLYRWDGASWTSRTLPQEATAGWANAPNDVWIAGYTNMMHFDGAFTTILGSGTGIPIGTAEDMYVLGDGAVTRWSGGVDGTPTTTSTMFQGWRAWRSPSGRVYVAGRGLLRTR